MKTIKVYEFKDLSIDIQKKIIEKDTMICIESDINCLEMGLTNKDITEEQFYNQLGCTKNYAETTGWFVNYYYYEKHKKVIDKEARAIAKTGLYTKNGNYIQSIK